ncbi:unnamed protein product [Cuscuta epithymum]|uniref:BHLH domain-containing protein n=2 Tax=Cuscuta epithymum TaxID=186058 RepID=A0AAV0ERL6_9ASTE|nr:unnamed protein product [Cuscuta epithymum]
MDRSNYVPGTSLEEFSKQPLHDMNLNWSPTDCRANDRPEGELKDNLAARKVQKADREKLRRDRMNEQFAELGSTLDPDRPKNDKASIIIDTIQMVKELTDQVSRLKDEYTALTEECRELTQEKNDLREEKASIRSDTESLNAEYLQRLRTVYPWAGMEHPLVMCPPPYPYPVPVPIPAGPTPLHPPMQPYPFFGTPNAAVMHNNCPTFVPYMTPNPIIKQPPAHIYPVAQPHNRTIHGSTKQDSRKRSDTQTSGDSTDDVATDLELKTPGSTSEVSSSVQKRAKKRAMEESSRTDASSSSVCSSSQSVHVLSASSAVGGDTKKDEKQSSREV